jgi:predicted DsbA family dithiol-disulfide isomerase
MKPKVIVYSDYICPFCYIGKRRIDTLIKEFDVDVEWKCFELHPETPKEGKDFSNFFDSDYIKMIRENVDKLANEVNLKFKLNSSISNSKLSLKVGEFAKTKNKFEPYHEAVFNAYFQEAKDIGDIRVIAEIAKKIGLNIKELTTYLRSNESDKILEKHKKEAIKDEINGVPTFIIGEKKIVGAQPYNVIRKVVESLK